MDTSNDNDDICVAVEDIVMEVIKTLTVMYRGYCKIRNRKIIAHRVRALKYGLVF
ncbi:hypothetical protein CDL12_25462 [Handroanthus impetiginosus]|uniref:Uncharacterized protein n=1 Tax=Handroanthus impetiginosus TaxID=429701 RepID=A0A2G9G9P7_9LAMI|nr:hypothetical protein CDL12_25462 [Handroanthus impetiginosus]